MPCIRYKVLMSSRFSKPSRKPSRMFNLSSKTIYLEGYVCLLHYLIPIDVLAVFD